MSSVQVLPTFPGSSRQTKAKSVAMVGSIAALLFLAIPSMATIKIAPPCALSSTNRTITVCTPGTSAVLSLPVHLVAATKDSNAVTSMQVLVDGVSAYQAAVSTVDVYLSSVAAGAHTITINATDSLGTFSQTLPVTVSANAGLTNIRHIIYLVQENHSFDNYFGMLGVYKASKGFPNNVDGLNLNATQTSYTTHQPIHP